MYELELAYMVVAHSQRDPGEYQLELQLFAEKPEGPLREFAINLHLQRISAAIKNLLAAGEAHFPQAVALARKEVFCTSENKVRSVKNVTFEPYPKCN